ncbi:MAG: SMC-Scp complex subunit ScpB [Tindallia sp. MSAO_Bac2]|nr:MAG: SMC-Scp complex subunit ScpB [Tindallia sp. MSAO_Bac2]
MSVEKKKAVLEALLFAWGEPIAAGELSKATGFSYKEVQSLLKEMEEDYKFYHRGILLIRMEDHYQIAANPTYAEYLEKLVAPQKQKSLSQAALEVLAIIAYRQPITRSMLDDIRGVKSDHAVRTLLEKNLIEEKGRMDKIGRPILYGTTHTFLKVYGLESLEDLPDPESFEEIEDETPDKPSEFEQEHLQDKIMDESDE